MAHRIAITVSHGPEDAQTFAESTHMLSYADLNLTKEQGEAIAKTFVAMIQGIRGPSGKEVMGVYKAEKREIPESSPLILPADTPKKH